MTSTVSPNEVQLGQLFYIISRFVCFFGFVVGVSTAVVQEDEATIAYNAEVGPRHVSLFIFLPCQFLNFAASSWAFSPPGRHSVGEGSCRVGRPEG